MGQLNSANYVSIPYGVLDLSEATKKVKLK